MGFSRESLDALYQSVKQSMSPYRFSHTEGVRRAAVEIGKLYEIPYLDELCAAALLHDITKELSVEEHVALMEKNNISVTENDLRSPKTLHAKTAELAAREKYPEFANERVCQALRYHTTGSENMTVFDAVIYLADYIEDTRTFEDCVYLRNYFWSAEPQKMTAQDRDTHLWQTVLLSLDMTVRDIEREGGYIIEATLRAREAIAKRLLK